MVEVVVGIGESVGMRTKIYDFFFWKIWESKRE